MRKVELNMKEELKYKTIKDLVDKGVTTSSKKRASVKLGCTIRTINRLITVYVMEGKQGFSHSSKGKAPPTKIDDELKRDIIDNYVLNYYDANLTHYSEIIEEDYNTKISAETIRLWLIEENIISPKTHKITKKRIKKRLKEELKKVASKSKSNEIKLKLEELDRKDVHPRRERCKYFGEMIQMDASELEWIKGVTWHLHVAIDDATSTVVGAYFDTEETLNGYYHIFAQILTNYGVPAMFYTDRRTVFEYVSKRRLFDYDDTFTQFSYACHKLGTQIKTTSVSEAKGRVERVNQTLQSRLPVELRRANVTCIEEANEFLKRYLKKFNDKFSLQLNITKSVFEPPLDKETINQTLSVLTVRTIDGGNSIKFKNKYYIPVNRNGGDVYLQEGSKIVVVETFDNKLYINALDYLYGARQIQKNSTYSKEFDSPKDNNTRRNGLSIPRNHPWKSQDFLNYLAKQKHRPEYNQKLC